jgi:hypothetical protein
MGTVYPDKVSSFWTQNPLSPDRHMAIFGPQNPLFSGQTYGGASGGLRVESRTPDMFPRGSVGKKTFCDPLRLCVLICTLTNQSWI